MRCACAAGNSCTGKWKQQQGAAHDDGLPASARGGAAPLSWSLVGRRQPDRPQILGAASVSESPADCSEVIEGNWGS